MATEQRKIDWARVIVAYAVPLIVLIGFLFVESHKLAEAEGKIETKVDKKVHTEVHKAVVVRLDTFDEQMIKIDARIEQVNFDAIERDEKFIQEQRTSTQEIIQAIKDK